MSRTRTVAQSTGAPAGVYLATVKDVEDGIESQFDNKMQVKFVFRIDEVLHSREDDAEEYVGEEQWAWANDYVSTGSKLFKWVQQILDTKLDVEDTFDLDDLIGQKCELTIGLNKNDRLTVTDLAAYRKPAKKPKRARRPIVEEEEDEDEGEEDPF